MKRRIICFGDSNTWGYDAEKMERFPESVRWTSLLGEKLGPDFQVVEEGLSGRTSVSDDPLFEGLNAFTYIHPCLMSHSPLELVIIMLGTNDTKERFNLTAYNIAQGIARLALKAKSTAAGAGGSFPKVLVVAPPPIRKEYASTAIGAPMGQQCDVKSEEFPIYLQELLMNQNIEYLNSNGFVTMNDIDYMHLDVEGHRLLAKLLFHKIQEIL